MKCKNCGETLNKGARFCQYCGEKIDRENFGEGHPSDDYIDGYSWFDGKGDTQKGISKNARSYTPEDIRDDCDEEEKTYSKLLLAIIIFGVVVIIATLIFAALVFGRGCSMLPVDSPAAQSSAKDATGTSGVQIYVPDVSGKAEESAFSLLEQEGFKVNKVIKNNDGVERGHVIDQCPVAGKKVEKGSTVTIFVSAGSSVVTSSEPTTSASTESTTNPQTVQEAPKDNNSYILPDSNTRYLDYDDLKGIDSWKLQLAINEIYARHGRRFRSTEVQAYFDKCTWYKGTIDPENFDEISLNKYEKANIDFIQQKQNGLGR